MLFSQRAGITSQKSIQIESIDEETKNGLWSMLDEYIFNLFRNVNSVNVSVREVNIMISNRVTFAKILWIKFFKEQVNNFRYDSAYKFLHTKFFSEFSWDKIFDFIEFILESYSFPDYREQKENFKKSINIILEQENSAYRLIDCKFADITSKEEIEEIEDTINDSPRPIEEQLKRALSNYSNRKDPDYRNSIKDSINAVESMCKLIVNNPKHTNSLTNALNVIEEQKIIKLNKSLKEGFCKIYNYTSAADGIRHALMEEPNLDSEDARYMLISCSAFINYLKIKASKANINLKGSGKSF